MALVTTYCAALVLVSMRGTTRSGMSLEASAWTWVCRWKLKLALLTQPNAQRSALVSGLEGQPLAVDFSVVHTLQQSTNLADVQPGKKAKRMENWKIKQSQALCARQGWSFAPFVMETVGTRGGKGRYVLQKVTKHYALTQQCSKAEAAVTCRTRLALALVRTGTATGTRRLGFSFWHSLSSLNF